MAMKGEPAKAAKYLSKQEAMQTREKKSVVVERELDRLYKKHGTVNQKMIVEKARAEKHPLHGYFEWNDAVAGEQFRLHQALTMIMASKFLVVIQQGRELPEVAHAEPVRKLLPQFGGGGFQARDEVLDNDEARHLLVERKMGALRAWCKSVIDIAELNSIRTALEEMLEPTQARAAG